jgi:hypothetical protein
LTENKCEFWQTEPDAVQGGECAVRALQAGANVATRRLWQPKTHLFMGEYLGAIRILTPECDRRLTRWNFSMPASAGPGHADQARRSQATPMTAIAS